ncbi:Dynein light chain 2, cytoplasmic [Merluccius polli]|uniref:Dynein light chain n=1 Tax=Merluccius polli TaxID=89951 RepID=A0AA47MT96_MERPO|nr:Dynein light chain 2, cytoplasmic [Merluccius polli]
MLADGGRRRARAPRPIRGGAVRGGGGRAEDLVKPSSTTDQTTLPTWSLPRIWRRIVSAVESSPVQSSLVQSGSRAAAAAAITMTDRKAVIKNADMSEDMQQDAVDCATQAMEKYNIEKDIAAYIKKEFDKKYNPTWHCIVGRNFGSYVTHETKHFIYFYLGQVAILLFKSG